MNLLSPFEFHAKFCEAKSMAIVGNAPTILDYEHGERIDQHDVVVRFNRATTAGLEHKIGSRTDILVVNASNNLDMAPPPSQVTNPQCLVSFVSPSGIPKLQPQMFQAWVEDIPIYMTFGMDMLGLKAKTHARPYTSGTYFLYLVAKMFQLEQVFMTGFTMFGAKQGETGKYYHDPRGDVGNFHDLDVETKTFRDLAALFGDRISVTPEIAELIGSGSRGQRRGIRARVASACSWRLIQLGMKIRRYSESAN